MNILITAPSLDENRNVSGISTVARQIIESSAHRFTHFGAGRADGEKLNAAWFLRQTNLPIRFFQTIRREKIEVAHVNTAFNAFSIVRDFALVTTARAAKCPTLLHIHGGRFLAEDFHGKKLSSLAERMLRAANSIVVLSELEKRIVENRWKNLNVTVLENAVAFEKAPKPRRNAAEKTIIFLGRLNESKGLNEIIEAVQKLKNDEFHFRFECFGAGEMKGFFVAEMNKILGDKFFYGGVVSGAEKWKALSRADVFLLPSRFGEGLPMAMLEAMAAGCVVVASEMASVGAVVKDGENGFLIEPKNVSQLIKKLKMIFSGKVDLDEIEKNARKTVAEKFNLPDYIAKLEKIYRELAEPRTK